MAVNITEPCAGCKEFLKVGNIVNNRIDWLRWQPSLSGLVNVVADNNSPLTIIVAKVQAFRQSTLCKGNCIDLLPHVFEEMFRMPQIWWSNWCRKSGGYFGSQDTFNQKCQLDGHNVWFRYDVKQTTDPWIDLDKDKKKRYTWWKTNVFIRWDATTGRTIVMILDPIPLLEDELLKKTDGIVRLIDPESLAQMGHANSPYYIPSLFMEAAVHIHDKAVWGIRDLVRDIEKEREQSKFHDPTSSSLHPGMRHTIHVTEMLETMLAIAVNMLQAHNLFVDENLVPAETTHQGDAGSLNKAPVNVINRQIVFRLRNAGVALQTLLNRAQANQSRLKNEVSLTTHVISTQIAEAARVDNSVMKTLGYLGTAFLPGTFIAAIFSMSFFGTSQQNTWIWHEEMWYYFAITLPVTAIVMLVTWQIHPRVQAKRAREREARRKAETERRKAEERANNAGRGNRTQTFSILRQRTMTGLTRVRTARFGREPSGQPMRMNNRKDEASAASTASVTPEQQTTQQMQEVQQLPQRQQPGVFAPASPGWPGSPGTADRGFTSMV